MTIIFDLDGVTCALVRIHETHGDKYPEDERFKFLSSFYGDYGDEVSLMKANEWLRATYAPNLSPREFSETPTVKGEHSPFVLALGALLKDIQQELSSKVIL